MAEKVKVNASILALRVAESLGRQRLYLDALKEEGSGLFFHEVKVQKDLCEMILKIADPKNEGTWLNWAKEGIKKCNEMIAEAEKARVVDPVDEIANEMEEEI